MKKNKTVFGFLVGIVSCVLFLFAVGSHLGAVLLLAAVVIFALTKGGDYFKLKGTVFDDQDFESDDLRERFTAVERRLTEVQDVMIALSEKMDRLEEKVG